MASVSIALRAEDNMSTTMTRIRNAVTPVRDDIDELQAELNRFNRTKVSLQVDLERAKRELADAKKAFKELGDEANATRLEKAQEAYNGITQQLQEVSRASKQTVKDMEEVTGAISKADNRASRGGSGGSEDTGIGASGSIALAAAGNMASQLLQSAAKTFVASAGGDEASNILGGVLSYGASGAAIGSMIAPGIGSAIGAAIGGIAGIAEGAMENWSNRDDAFKDYYTGIIDDLAEARETSLSGGSEQAASRERDLSSLSVLIGNAGVAGLTQSQLIELGRTPPFSYETSTAYMKDMLGMGLSRLEAMDRLESLADAAAALDLSESNISTIISSLENASIAGKLDTRVVKTLTKMGVNSYEAIASEFGISQDQVLSQLGDLDADRAIKAIYAYMGERFAGAASGLASTYEGATSVAESYQEDFDAARGASYNEVRMSGLQAQIDSFAGSLGDAITKQNEAEGALAAYRENLQEQYTREALNAVMNGVESSLEGLEMDKVIGDYGETLGDLSEQYHEASEAYDRAVEVYGKNSEEAAEASRKMENLYDQAGALAQAAYDSSGWAKTELSAQEENTVAIRNLTSAFSGWSNSYAIAQERTKGQGAAASMQVNASTSGDGWVASVPAAQSQGYAAISQSPVSGSGASTPYGAMLSGRTGSHASGLTKVPYDNYLAFLHEGERVLTAREVREDERGGGKVFDIRISLEGAAVRTEADIGDIAQQLADNIMLKLRAGLS